MSRFVVGGSSGLTLEGVTVNDLALASDLSELVLMQSEADSITGSTFDGLRGSSEFSLATINLLRAAAGQQNSTASLQGTSVTDWCVTLSSAGANASTCGADDDANLTTIVIKHPGLTLDEL